MPQLICDDETRKILEQRASSHKEPHRNVFRARIILGCLDGRGVVDLARELKTRPNTVIKWRDRFAAQQLEGLEDQKRSGTPRRLPLDLPEQIVRLLEEPPPPGQAVWEVKAVASRLGVSPHSVWRILRSAGICLQRQRSWYVSTAPEFVAKTADIIGLYLAPPTNALVICVDERPSIQALDRSTAYVEINSGKILRAFNSTYKRHGTLNLSAALQLVTGHIHGRTASINTRKDFFAFMGRIVAGTPANKELHVILDNSCNPDGKEGQLSNNPRVYFHPTSTSASWLNQVKVWFDIMSCNASRSANFTNLSELSNAIEAFIANYAQNPQPFKWRKREKDCSELANTIANFCN